MLNRGDKACYAGRWTHSPDRGMHEAVRSSKDAQDASVQVGRAMCCVQVVLHRVAVVQVPQTRVLPRGDDLNVVQDVEGAAIVSPRVAG